MPKLFQKPRVTVAEESKIIAGVRAGKGHTALAAQLGRPAGTVKQAIDRLVRQGALKAEEVGKT